MGKADRNSTAIYKEIPWSYGWRQDALCEGIPAPPRHKQRPRVEAPQSVLGARPREEGEIDEGEEAQRRRWAQLTGEGDGGLDSERRQEEGRHDVGDEVQRGGIAWMMALLPDDCHVRTLSPSPYVFDDSSQAGFGCRN